MKFEVLARVVRGETVESIHRGHLIVVDGDGKVIHSVGDPSLVTFFRSAAKPFQAMPMITSGAADAFGFTDDEIAMACSSHSGEPIHVERTARMLAKIGLSESDLRCGVHLPFYSKESERMLRAGESATQLHNNCSGKHAAMLALARHIDSDIQNYDAIENRVQKRILRCVSDLSGIPESDIAIGIDGCCVPNFAVPIAAMANSFARLIMPSAFHPVIQTAARRIVEAMVKYPELIGGTDRLDTQIMQAGGGRVISKVGADGVWLGGVLPGEKYPTGLGIALKIEDGDDHRGRPVVAVEILRQLGILSHTDLAEISPMPIKNRRGDIVGRVEAALTDFAVNNI